jgi:hypothetical protein
MNDEQIGKVYNEGNNESHVAGLRAVYNAGRNHDEWEREQRAIAAKAAAKTPGAAPAATAEHEPFDQMTNAELRAYLDARSVTHASGDTKAELERAARAAERKEKAAAGASA